MKRRSWSARRRHILEEVLIKARNFLESDASTDDFTAGADMTSAYKGNLLKLSKNPSGVKEDTTGGVTMHCAQTI